MARIAIDARISRSWSTGVGVYTLRLVEALAAARCEQRFVLLRGPHAPAAPLGVEQRTLGWAPATAGQHALLPFALRRLGIELLVSMHPATAPLWSFCPRLAFVHDLIPLALPEEYGRAKRLYFRTVVRRALLGAARVLVDSECTRRDCRSLLGLPDAKLRVVYGGPGIVGGAVAGASPSSGRPYFLYVGNKRPHKNVEALIRGFARLCEQDQVACDLVIAGRDEPGDVETDGRRLRALADSLGLNGRARFAGEVRPDELPALYAGATALVYLSRYEGLGLPPLEAMACGTPVVALRAGSLPEVVGEGGVLLNSDEPAAVAGALQALLADASGHARLRAGARRQAARFSWQATADAVLEEIELALKGRAAA